MNENNTEGIEILSFKELPDDAVNAMASISAADYEVRFRDGYKPAFSCIEAFNELYSQEEISVLKQVQI